MINTINDTMLQIRPAIAVPWFLFFSLNPIAPNIIPSTLKNPPPQQTNTMPSIPSVSDAIPNPLCRILSPLSYIDRIIVSVLCYVSYLYIGIFFVHVFAY